MTVDVAMDVLGLSGEPTAVEVRRAYLRQVKAHPPERDADGFRLVREAYERLQIAYAGPLSLSEVPKSAEVVPKPVDPGPRVVVPEPKVVVPEPRVVVPEPVDPEPRVAATEVLALPRSIQEQLELLKRALADGDPLAAADSMIWLYGRPLLESAPVAEPLLALDTMLALMERGRFRRARALLNALESYLLLNPRPGGFGSEVGARWKLAGELLAVSQLDARLGACPCGGLA